MNGVGWYRMLASMAESQMRDCARMGSWELASHFAGLVVKWEHEAARREEQPTPSVPLPRDRVGSQPSGTHAASLPRERGDGRADAAVSDPRAGEVSPTAGLDAVASSVVIASAPVDSGLASAVDTWGASPTLARSRGHAQRDAGGHVRPPSRLRHARAGEVDDG